MSKAMGEREIFRRLEVLGDQIIRLGTRLEDALGGPQSIDSLTRGSLLSRVSKLEERVERPEAEANPKEDDYE